MYILFKFISSPNNIYIHLMFIFVAMTRSELTCFINFNQPKLDNITFIIAADRTDLSTL